LAEGTHLIRLEGRQVYRFAVSQMISLMKWGMEGQDPEDLGLIVPHQVNRRILEKTIEMLDIAEEKMFINIDYYGNTSAASVPIALTEARDQGRLEKGKLVVLAAFGSGLTWAGARIRW
jgi:3-oxoacyl-[acyl-carrier-protein] synthase-3